MTLTQLLPDRRVLGGQGDLEQVYAPPGGEHLRLNFIASLDGAVEVGGRSGPLGGPADRSAFLAMRAVADAILVGAGTVRAEDYGPVRVAADARARREARGQSSRPVLAVVTGRAALDRAARLFGGDRVVVFTTETALSGRPDLPEAAEVVACGRTTVDLAAVVQELRRRGMGRILCEGGPVMARGLLTAGLVDELCLTLAPVVAGAGRRLVGEEPMSPAGPFCLTGLLESDSLLLARYRIPEGAR